jgi:hypothetical protein
MKNLCLLFLLLFLSSCLVLEKSRDNPDLTEEELEYQEDIKRCNNRKSFFSWFNRKLEHELSAYPEIPLSGETKVVYSHLSSPGVYLDTYLEKVNGRLYCANEAFLFVDLYEKGQAIGKVYSGIDLFFSLEDNEHIVEIHTLWFEEK